MPTENQKIVFEKVAKKVRKGDKVAVSREMQGVYSDSFSKEPSRLIQSKGWQELMEQHLPEKDLLKVHREGLKAGKKIFKNNNATGEIEEVGVEPDYATRHKYLDTGYKLRGSYAPEKSINLNLTLLELLKLQMKERNNHDKTSDSDSQDY